MRYFLLLLFMIPAFAFGAAGLDDLQTALVKTDVDVELVLAVDTSATIDARELVIQRQGYANTLNDTEFQWSAFGHNRKLALYYFEFDFEPIAKRTVQWAIIDSAESASKFANAIMHLPNAIRKYDTGLANAINHATDEIVGNGISANRKIIDVSGDGYNNEYPSIESATSYAMQMGIDQINGLLILIDPVKHAKWHYETCVKQGHGAFIQTVSELSQFNNAIKRKMMVEVGGTFLHYAGGTSMPEIVSTTHNKNAFLVARCDHEPPDRTIDRSRMPNRGRH